MSDACVFPELTEPADPQTEVRGFTLRFDRDKANRFTFRSSWLRTIRTLINRNYHPERLEPVILGNRNCHQFDLSSWAEFGRFTAKWSRRTCFSAGKFCN